MCHFVIVAPVWDGHIAGDYSFKELPRLFDRRASVEAETGIDFRRDAAGDDLQDLAAEIHEDPVDVAVHQVPESRVLGGSEQQRRVGRGVLGLPARDLERVARELKRGLGCGATVEGDTIVLQGDLAGRAGPWLAARGVRKIVL